MNEKEIEIKSEETTTETTKVEEKNPMLTFPWSDEENVDYRFADLHTWCRNCGHDSEPKHPMLQNIQTMLPVNLLTNNKAMLGLGCDNCGSQVVLHFRDAANPPSEEEIAAAENAQLEARLREQVAEIVPEEKKEVTKE